MRRRQSNRVEWIVCERTSRWASALRMALLAAGRPCQLRELRHLAELDAEVETRANALVAIEVGRDNFAEALAWYCRAHQRHSCHCLIALMDRSLAKHLAAVSDALVEAGAHAIATSPRRLTAIMALATQYAAVVEKTAESTALATSVWDSLPWQAR
jgi:hypothetical protein